MSFWKPGTSQPGSALDRTSESSSALITSSPSSSATLPIQSARLSILHALETHLVLILISPTGSGKTTLLPPLLLNSGWASSATIACTQPRRVAATSIAAHVASSLNVRLGEQVGYTIRFEDHSNERTKIRYMTDGALFRECIRDPLLTRYSVVMVDEVHERGLYTDLLLGVLKKVCRKRRDLRVIVASATVDALSLKDFFDDEEAAKATIIKIEGRTFPVHTAFLRTACKDYVAEMAETIWKVHTTEPRGDTLAFLTGREEIDSTLQLLADRQADLSASAARMHLVPLHAGLTAQEQTDIFSPSPEGMRKVVVATNIAEASITLDGIVYVIDCGLVKTRTSSPDSPIDVLAVVPISKASAIQRAGRAGRTRAGKCFRLYPESSFCAMQSSTPPELHRIGPESPVLMLKSLGVDNLVRFEWLPPAPPVEALSRALERLLRLGALDEFARLTPVGEMMGQLPLPPHLGRVLIASGEPRFACAQEILSILSMMSITQPFVAMESTETQLSRRSFTAQEGDLMTLLNIFLAFSGPTGAKSRNWCTKHRLNFHALSRALNIRTQLERYLIRFSPSFNLDPNSSVLGTPTAIERITRCLATGLYTNLARYNPPSMTYLTPTGIHLSPHPSSTLFNRQPHAHSWILYGDATQAADGRIFIRDICVLTHLTWLTETVPGMYDVKVQRGTTGRIATSASGEL